MTVKREVYYFEKAGEQNTDYVIEAVKERMKQGDLTCIVVASNSGKTALKLTEAVRYRKSRSFVLPSLLKDLIGRRGGPR